MTRLGAIRILGDVITEIDVARGQVEDPFVRIRLDDARTLLNHRLIQLVNEQSDESSVQFQEALATLEAYGSEIARGNLRIESIDELIGNTNLLTSLPGGTTTDDPGKKKPKP